MNQLVNSVPQNSMLIQTDREAGQIEQNKQIGQDSSLCSWLTYFQKIL